MKKLFINKWEKIKIDEKNAIIVIKKPIKEMNIEGKNLDIRILYNLQENHNIKEQFFIKGKKIRIFRVIVGKKRSHIKLRSTYEMKKDSMAIINTNAFLLNTSKLELKEIANVNEKIEEIHLRQQIYLYSIQARAKATPQLNLKTNQIKAATHESTISDINEKEKEYFALKGMEVNDVQNLLLKDYLSYFE